MRWRAPYQALKNPHAISAGDGPIGASGPPRTGIEGYVTIENRPAAVPPRKPFSLVPLMPEAIPAGDCLVLRRWRASMIDELMAAIGSSQPDLARWLPWAEPPPSLAAELEVVQQAEHAFEEDRDYGYFLIEAPAELIGCAGLHLKGGGVAEIGYWVRSDRTGQGFATSAAGALCMAAFAYLPDVDKVIIRMDQGNLASASIPPRIGFELEGEEALRDILTSRHTGKGWIWSKCRPA